MVAVKLERAQWLYDPAAPLGPPGGFGAVFAGTGPDGSPVAVKRLHVQASEVAHRELRIARDLGGRSLRHVMPVLDAGQDADSDAYFVIMPRAEHSLEQLLKRDGPLAEEKARSVLGEIADGLGELPHIVHRDLKPANVLRHDSAWKIADFGIARFVEEATSAHTLRGCLSPPYAAPEQWQEKRATTATDIYSLACIAYALLTGSPPFAGPGIEDFAQQHLLSQPPKLLQASPRLQSLLFMMLKKEAQLRPSLERVREQLRIVTQPSRHEAGANALALAGAAIGEAQAREEANRAAEAARAAERLKLARAALDDLSGIAKDLCDRCVSIAPQAEYEFSKPTPVTRVHRVSLGLGELRIGAVSQREVLQANAMSNCGWDVVTSGAIVVEVRDDHRNVTYRRSSSLWFTDRGDKGGGYRWHELSFMIIVGRSDPRDVPYVLEPGRDADMAIAPGMHTHQLATTPRPIDGEDKDAFIDRWMELFAKAAAGTLRPPSTLPISD